MRASTPRPGTVLAPGRLDAGSRAGALPALVIGCLGGAGLSLLAPSTPTYDPWAWLGWGREILHLDLATTGGPAFKPLPVAFTTVFSLFGGAAPSLWLVLARAGGLLAIAMAFRLSRRLAGRGAVGLLAGVVAAGALLSSSDFVRTTALGDSEGLLVGLVLLAVERHLDGHRTAALWLGFAAALLRPEVWPFLGLYGLWLAAVEPRRRGLVATLAVLVPALWLLPELWGSGHLLRSVARAQQVTNPDQPALAAHPALAVARQARRALIAPLQASAALAAVVALVRLARRRPAPPDLTTLALAIGALAWIALVAALAQGGYSGEPRYLIPPVGLVAVLAGVGLARVAEAIGALGSRALPAAPRGSALAAGAAVALLIAVAPFALARSASLRRVGHQLDFQASVNRDLDLALRRAGGRRGVLRCGRPATNPYFVPALAWRLDVPTRRVGIAARAPGDVFRAPVDRGHALLPAAPGPGSPLHPVARAGAWTVLRACAPGQAG